MLVLQKDDRIKMVSSINSRLERLTEQTMLTPISESWSSLPPRCAKYDLRVRGCAIDLHSLLEDRLHKTRACQCPEPHNASLVLTRNAPTNNLSNHVRFNVMLSFDPKLNESLPWNWKEVELKNIPIERSRGQDSPDRRPLARANPLSKSERRSNPHGKKA